MSSTVLNASSCTTRLIVRENRRCSTTLPFVFPPGLTHLHAPLHLVRLARKCLAITDLTCLPTYATFPVADLDLVPLLTMVEEGAWPALSRVLFVPEARRRGGDGQIQNPWNPEEGNGDGKALHHAQFACKMLEVLVQHRSLEHITLFLGHRYLVMVQQLASPSMRSMTLVGVEVCRGDMQRLLQMPGTGLVIELIGVTGYTTTDHLTARARAQARSGTQAQARVIFRPLSVLLSSEACVML